MKRTISVILAAIMIVGCIFAFAGCSGKNKQNYDVVLITDGAAINDKGYNQSAWNGIKSYADENKLSCRYYQPQLNEDGELESATVAKYVNLAAKEGAKQVVLPGEVFAASVCDFAPKYEKMQFVLIDAYPHKADDNTEVKLDNVMSVSFDNLQAGFLAGYAAVSMGNTKLGYFGSSTSQKSIDCGSGYVQGAAYAADESSVPTVLDYAEYDAPNLKYDYSFTIEPVYKKISESKDTVYKVKVVNGVGTGAYKDGENVTISADPAKDGKVFDHWDVKSDTAKVSDKKVNISSKKKSTMNLLVGDCDCTITAVYSDADTVPVTVNAPDGTKNVTYATKNSKITVTAPAAQSGYIFDSWSTDDDSILSDKKSKETEVSVADKAVELTPNYVQSEEPTFTVTVKDGTGSGIYVTGDSVNVVADAPADGYMFYKWENIDNQGKSTGIAMENEYNYSTSFEMVDRYSSIVEDMFDEGTQVVFGGNHKMASSIFTAINTFDTVVSGIGYGIDQKDEKNCIASVILDYGKAASLALKDFKGGTTLSADCSNDCLYVTNISTEEYSTDKDGNKTKNDNYNAGYVKAYKALADGKISVKPSDGDITSVSASKCLTLNNWVK